MLRIYLFFFTFILLAGCTSEPLPSHQRLNTDPEAILNQTWQWESTTTPVGKIIAPIPGNYTIRLSADGRASLRIDCNRGRGAFKISQGKLSFSPLMTTRMACKPGSMDGAFMKDLQLVISFFVQDKHLYLELPYDSGTMKFYPDSQ